MRIRTCIGRGALAALILTALTGCIVCDQAPGHRSATGKITGRVVDTQGAGVPDIHIQALYLRGWTTVMPPVPNAFLVATARADRNGFFEIATTKRVDWLTAGESSRIESVFPSGNVIRLGVSARPLPTVK